MVTDRQVKKLKKLIQTEATLKQAADKAGMDEKTARKYRRAGKLPSEMKRPRTWRTRTDPFATVWDEVKVWLSRNPGLEGKTLFEELQRRYPERFEEGQLRTLQRKIKAWRAVEGPPKEVFFPQLYHPGDRSESDFTHMKSLGITLAGRPFDHLLYHFVLPYSNWETGTVCFSESFESLSDGLQNALWTLGGVPQSHQTDQLTAAVYQGLDRSRFTTRYQGLLKHYRLEGRKTQPASPHENGDVEQRHHRFKRAVEQALMLRGHRDFADREAYEHFLQTLFQQLNQNRKTRFAEELKQLHPLPAGRLESCKQLTVKVGPSSTIHVAHNTYSVDSRLIGETIQVRVLTETLELWYGQRLLETLPRLRGDGGHHIQYRHLITWLVRKPGAFENYRYRQALYPTTRFRLAYDQLKRRYSTQGASRRYLQILQLAATESETAVDQALNHLIEQPQQLAPEAVKAFIRQETVKPTQEIAVDPVNLHHYDALLSRCEVVQ